MDQHFLSIPSTVGVTVQVVTPPSVLFTLILALSHVVTEFDT